MATLDELQDQLAILKERYSAVKEGSYSYEESIATIAVNMQAQLDDAQAAASSAGVYAAAAESAADEAADAGAEAGATAGAEAGATAGAAAAQTKYDDIFTQEHSWDKTQTFYSLIASNVKLSDLEVTGSVSALTVAGKVVASEVSAHTFSASILKLDIDGADSGAQFNATDGPYGISVDITGYSKLSNGTSYITDAVLRASGAYFKYMSVEETISIDDVSLDKPELQYLKSLIKPSATTNYYEDSYFENLWADKQTDDIYIRRLYKYAYNTAPAITPITDSLPEKVTLTLKTGATRVYDNALHTLFTTTAPNGQYVSKIVTANASECYDPVLEHTLLGFWERCNYYKDENGDTRIVAVRGEEGFDKRKPDVGTFGPAIWFDVRDSLDVDASGNPMYTEVIVSTAPHPELGLHPHPLAMRHDGTVAPYWCCSAYPGSLSSTGALVSVYNGYTELSANGSYNESNISAQEIFDKCREKSGKGYGDGSYIASLLQLMHIIKYGTKDSQSIMRGVCSYSYGTAINVPTADSITAVYSEFDVTKDHHWIPLELNTDNKNFLSKCNAVWVDGIIEIQGSNTCINNSNSRPYMITSVDEYSGILRVWLETDYSIKYSFNTDNNPAYYKITAAKAVAGCTDNVYSKYDGPAMYSACRIVGSNAATNGCQPFRLHGIEYGLQRETFMDKVWVTASGVAAMTENGTRCYYRLPWEYKYADTTSSPVHATTEMYASAYYGTDYSTKVIANNYADSGYDIVISTPTCTVKTGSSSEGLCDYYGTPYAGYGLQTAGGWGGPNDGPYAGLFCCGYGDLDYGSWGSGARI